MMNKLIWIEFWWRGKSEEVVVGIRGGEGKGKRKFIQKFKFKKGISKLRGNFFCIIFLDLFEGKFDQFIILQLCVLIN